MKVTCKHCGKQYDLEKRAEFYLTWALGNNQEAGIGTDCPHCGKSWWVESLIEGPAIVRGEL